MSFDTVADFFPLNPLALNCRTATNHTRNTYLYNILYVT